MNGDNPPSPQTPPLLYPATPPAAPTRRRGWIVHLALLGAYPLSVAALSWKAGKLQGAPALGTGPRDLFIVCAIQMVSFGIIFGLAWLGSRASRDDLLLRWRGGFKVLLLGTIYSVGIRLLLGLILAVIVGILLATGAMNQESVMQFFKVNRPDVESLVDMNALKTNPAYFWLSITLVSFVVAGLREELWRSGFLAGMRAVWPRSFGTVGGQMLAAGVAAIIFGLGHLMQGMLAVGLTAVLGFALGAIMVSHRSIWPAVVAHGMFDATSFALLPLMLETTSNISKLTL